ncbi:protein of unknown function [Tenacibaculum sp. 190130A14a]|uniref:Uncharacterized protein n=1 Tax=Tenacibaculum polynesiense TaxID=3137857 RepID=A0ABP1F314_9FLAO
MIAFVFGILFYAAIYFYMRYDDLKKSEKQRVKDIEKIISERKYLETKIREIQGKK